MQARRFSRFGVEIMNIRGRMMLSSMVEILDLHRDGMTLMADMRLNLGTEYVLKLDDDLQSLKVRGVVESSSILRTVQNDEGDVIPIYSAELKFLGMSDEFRGQLEHFIDRHRTGEAEKLKHLIFKVDVPEHVALDIPAGYLVKKLSLGGMLIVSGQPVAVEQRLPMELGLPGMTALQLIGRVACCIEQQTGNGPSFDIGIEFMDMSAQDRERLDEFIHMLQNQEEMHKDIWKHQKDR